MGSHLLHLPLHPIGVQTLDIGLASAHSGIRALWRQHLGHPHPLHPPDPGHYRLASLWRDPLYIPLRGRRLSLAFPLQGGPTPLGPCIRLHEPDRSHHPDPLPVRCALV